MAKAQVDVSQLGPAAQKQIRDQIAAEGPARPKASGKNKFGAVRTEYKSIQGFTRLYDSKAEARHAALLDLWVQAKEIRWWIPQVPFPLPGRSKYVADFLVVFADGRIEVVDCKGVDTPVSKLKRRIVFQAFGVDVQIVRRGDRR